jgi:hypothetical protein
MDDLDIKILENEIDEKRFMEKGWGSGGERILNNKHIKALKKGKKLGFFDGEYTTIVSYEKEKLN